MHYISQLSLVKLTVGMLFKINWFEILELNI